MRIYGNVSDATLHLIDEQAVARRLNRSEWVSLAIENYLHLTDMKMAAQEMREQMTEQGQEIAHLKEIKLTHENEIQHLRALLNELKGSQDNVSNNPSILPPSVDEAKQRKWWQPWKKKQAFEGATHS